MVIIKKKNKKQSENEELQFINAEFAATIKSSSKNSSKTLIKNPYEPWLLDNAQKILKDKVERCSKKLGISVERVNIKNPR
jgi:predicted metal-dependent hydrolase